MSEMSKVTRDRKGPWVDDLISSNVPTEDTRNMPQGEEDTESEIEGITIEVKWLCKMVLSLCKHIDKLQAAVKTDFNSAQAEVDVLKVDISLLKSAVHNELSSPGLLLISVHQRSKHLSLRPLAEPGMPGVGKLFVWNKVRDYIGFPKKTLTIRSSIKWIRRLYSEIRKHFKGMAVALVCTVYHLWRLRNSVLHDEKSPNLDGPVLDSSFDPWFSVAWLLSPSGLFLSPPLCKPTSCLGGLLVFLSWWASLALVFPSVSCWLSEPYFSRRTEAASWAAKCDPGGSV
nr:uncharacterized protein LOC105180093 [Ipomoea batatas]